MPSHLGRRAKILIVDDQSHARVALGRLLTELGFGIVETAGGAVEAMQAIETARERFDVVLCDLSMPSEDGLVFLRRLAELEEKPFVILVSGADPLILESAGRLAARFGLAMLGVIQKPVTAAALDQLLSATANPVESAVPVTPTVLTAEDILAGLTENRFELWFQPQYHIESGRVVGVEALLRLRDDERGILGPASFIELAERAGLIDRLTDLALGGAITQCADWQSRGWHLTVSVNLSGAGLRDITLPDRATAMCRARDLDPGQVVLELTESSLGSDLTAVLDIATRLRLAGFGLSIDDFGTGYASLAELESLPFQELKLDQVLVQRAVTDARALTILKNTVRLASELKMSIVAEGVETEAMFQMAAGLACDRVQGHFIARPMPARHVEAWLAQHALEPIHPYSPDMARSTETSAVVPVRPTTRTNRVERFAHNAASPLMAMLVLSDTLMKDETQGGQQLEDVRSIHQAALELSSMIDALRAHSAGGSAVAPDGLGSEETMDSVAPDLDRSTSRLAERVETYATWVRDFRQGSARSALVTDDSDPLALLGLELETMSAAIVSRESELQTLFALVHDAEAGVTLDDILDRVYTGFRGIIPFDRIGCAFLSDDRRRVITYWARSDLGPLRIAPGFERPVAGSTLEAILISGRPRVINDLERYLAAKPKSDTTRLIVEEGGRSSLTCPLFANGQPLGFLFFTSRFSNSYHKSHESVFLQIADQVASLLDKSRLHERLIVHNRTLLERTQRLEAMATHDCLTGVLNRGAIEAVLESGRAQQEYDHRFGVIMADIDHFKAINDGFGHAIGDLALREFVHRLSTVVRKGDTIARFGGEEFLIVLNDVTSDQLAAASERYRRSVSDTPFVLAARVLPVSASFGAALTDVGEPIQDLLGRADTSLYAAKEGGRNRCEMASPLERRLQTVSAGPVE
jgi:diguanylate cyclase (GGDEF)-like protein